MAIVKKFTMGVTPFAKMFRVHGLGGAAIDAVLRLRSRGLSDNFFSEVGTNDEKTVYKATSSDRLNTLQITEESVTFTKDFYDATVSFDFRKMLEEFRAIWTATQKVLSVQDVRRIGMVAEYQYKPDAKSASGWLRSNFTTSKTSMATEKFMLRFEEREFAADGTAPNPKESDFLNYIYSFYDSAIDSEHPVSGSVNVDLDVQRYFAPVLTKDACDEVLKLHKYFESAQRRLDVHLKEMIGSHGKR